MVLSASGSAIPNDVKVLNGGKLDVRYVPVEAGELCIDVTFNNEHVPGMLMAQAGRPHTQNECVN